MPARYDAAIAPLVRQVMAADGHPVVDTAAPLPPGPPPLTVLIQRNADAPALRAVTNGQRTSTRGGIEKGEAVLQSVHTPTSHGADDLAGVADLMIAPEAWAGSQYFSSCCLSAWER